MPTRWEKQEAVHFTITFNTDFPEPAALKQRYVLKIKVDCSHFPIYANTIIFLLLLLSMPIIGTLNLKNGCKPL